MGHVFRPTSKILSFWNSTKTNKLIQSHSQKLPTKYPTIFRASPPRVWKYQNFPWTKNRSAISRSFKPDFQVLLSRFPGVCVCGPLGMLSTELNAESKLQSHRKLVTMKLEVFLTPAERAKCFVELELILSNLLVKKAECKTFRCKMRKFKTLWSLRNREGSERKFSNLGI